jgi:hypothetical protein
MNCTGFNSRDLGSLSLTKLLVTVRDTVEDCNWGAKRLLLHLIPHIARAINT